MNARSEKEPTLGLITAEEGERGYLYLDYDNVSLADIRGDVTRLQERFRLGNATLVRSSKGKHHVFFFHNMLTWRENLEVIAASKHADPEFLEFKRNTKFSRVRILGKELKIMETIKSPYHKQTKDGEFNERTYKRLLGVVNG